MTRINSLLNGTGEVIKEAGKLLYKTGKGYAKIYIGLGKLCINATSALGRIQESKGQTLDSLREDFYSEGLEVAPQIRAKVEARKEKKYKDAQMNEFLNQFYGGKQ